MRARAAIAPMLAAVALLSPADAMAAEVLVRFTDASRARAVERAGVEAERITPLKFVRGVALVALAPGETVADAVKSLDDAPGVAWAEPNQVFRADATPDDQRFAEQWGLFNNGQGVDGLTGVLGADLDALAAWDVTHDARGALLAVVDGGLDINHPDLAGQVWSNPLDPANGADDDGNGLVDDTRGWDFWDNDNNVTPSVALTDRHGTHVLGIAAARGNNALGVAGMAWEASVVGIDVLADNNIGNEASVADGLAYAGSLGASVVNASLSNTGTLPLTIQQAVNNYPQTLFVVSAGNDASNNDLSPRYPCNLAPPANNLVCVAASTNQDALWTSSNFGAASVDLAAPGHGILSLAPNSLYRVTSGTSMASPYVAAVAATIRARNPGLTPKQVADALCAGTERLAAFAGVTACGGRLNACSALLAAAGSSAPGAFALSGPVEGALATDGGISVGWGASTAGLDRYEVVVDDGVLATASRDAREARVALVDGAHRIAVRAVDCRGNATTTPAVTVLADTTAPSSPTPSTPAIVNSRRPRLSWGAATDTTSGIAGYSVAVDGGAPGRVDGLEHTVAADLADGAHSFSVAALDRAGLSSAPVSAQFVIDTVKPRKPRRLRPRSTRNRRPRLAWRASPGAVAYAVVIGGARPALVADTSYRPPKRLRRGRHRWRVRAIDAAGNQSAATAGTLRVRRG
jgi:subtilisin family serine protease